MKRIHWVIVSVLTITSAAVQNYPVKPIRVVTAEPGGGNDFFEFPSVSAGLVRSDESAKYRSNVTFAGTPLLRSPRSPITRRC
jgi:hypothetical protein